MTALLLQKSDESSELKKKHLKTLTRLLSFWTKGKIDELLCEVQTIQSHLKAPDNAKK